MASIFIYGAIWDNIILKGYMQGVTFITENNTLLYLSVKILSFNSFISYDLATNKLSIKAL